MKWWLTLKPDNPAWQSATEQGSLRWHHNERDCASNHQPRHCLLNRLFGRRSKKTSKLRVTGLCAGHSPGTGEFPAQTASNAENVSIWWHHHVYFQNNCYVRNHERKLMSDFWAIAVSADGLSPLNSASEVLLHYHSSYLMWRYSVDSDRSVNTDSTFTHWGWDKKAAISQTAFWSVFPWMKTFKFKTKFHRNMFFTV